MESCVRDLSVSNNGQSARESTKRANQSIVKPFVKSCDRVSFRYGWRETQTLFTIILSSQQRQGGWRTEETERQQATKEHDYEGCDPRFQTVSWQSTRLARETILPTSARRRSPPLNSPLLARGCKYPRDERRKKRKKHSRKVRRHGALVYRGLKKWECRGQGIRQGERERIKVKGERVRTDETLGWVDEARAGIWRGNVRMTKARATETERRGVARKRSAATQSVFGRKGWYKRR